MGTLITRWHTLNSSQLVLIELKSGPSHVKYTIQPSAAVLAKWQKIAKSFQWKWPHHTLCVSSLYSEFNRNLTETGLFVQFAFAKLLPKIAIYHWLRSFWQENFHSCLIVKKSAKVSVRFHLVQCTLLNFWCFGNSHSNNKWNPL